MSAPCRDVNQSQNLPFLRQWHIPSGEAIRWSRWKRLLWCTVNYCRSTTPSYPNDAQFFWQHILNDIQCFDYLRLEASRDILFFHISCYAPIHMLPNIPAKVFRKLFIVSSASGPSRSRAIWSTVLGDGGPEILRWTYADGGCLWLLTLGGAIGGGLPRICCWIGGLQRIIMLVTWHRHLVVVIQLQWCSIASLFHYRVVS